VTAHFGYGHLIPKALAAHGHEVARVTAELGRVEARDKKERSLQRRHKLKKYIHARTRVLADQLGPDDMVANLDVRPILARLSRNGIVMTTGDGLRSLQFTHLPLLGQMYPFPNGLLKVAMQVGASVLPVYAIQDGRFGKIRIEIQPALPVDARLEITENVRMLAESLEEQLRRRPHLWYRWTVANWFKVAMEWSNADRQTRFKSALKQGKETSSLH
jgi:lauroyl/myristoyl acyltransferase